MTSVTTAKKKFNGDWLFLQEYNFGLGFRLKLQSCIEPLIELTHLIINRFFKNLIKLGEEFTFYTTPKKFFINIYLKSVKNKEVFPL
jgi:hypothetical protein